MANAQTSREALHYPRLDTILMVEETIRAAKEYPNKAGLLKHLPKKMMYQTFLLILDYLEQSNKIYIDKEDGRIVWIWDPEGVRKLLKPELLVR